MKTYDVIIVGAGPAGIFAALELVRKNNLDILILEKGKPIEERNCPAREENCIFCRPCAITSGWGGAGAFSDGKLTLSPKVGGWLGEIVSLEELKKLISEVDQTFQNFGAPPDREYGLDEDKVREIRREAVLAELTLIPVRMKHLGTDNCYLVLKNLYNFLKDKVEIKFNEEAEKLLVREGRIKGVLTKRGEYHSRFVIVAPGREGADWLTAEAKRLGLFIKNNAVDIGLRVEVPAAVMEPLTSVLYEAKLIYHSKSFEDQVRTFCMNPYGVVSTEVYEDVITVNGHSYAEKKTKNTNFALLVSTKFTEPFKEPISYGKYIARLANLLGGGIIIQRLADLKKGRRSTWERIERSVVEPTLKNVTPGDLSFVLPYRYLKNILKMLEAMDKIAPGVFSGHSLLYGVEVKFYSSRLNLSGKLETEVEGLYAVGDGAGVTRGLVQSSASGLIATRAILNDLKKKGKV
jgi:hypothetical protein